MFLDYPENLQFVECYEQVVNNVLDEPNQTDVVLHNRAKVSNLLHPASI